MSQGPFPVTWLKTVHTRTGKALRRVPATVISTDGFWVTVETQDKKRWAVTIHDLAPAGR